MEWTAMNTYATATHGQIHATLALLQHFRAFLASPCTAMRDPLQVDEWRDGSDRLTKAQARQRLTWLVHVAISRKGGYADDTHSREISPLNHRGTFPRKRTGDAQRHLGQLAGRVNTPRLRVYLSELGEWRTLAERLPHRFSTYQED
jgi:hypothetical protein